MAQLSCEASISHWSWVLLLYCFDLKSSFWFRYYVKWTYSYIIAWPDVQVFVYLTVVQDLGQSVIVTSQILMLMMVLELFLQVRGWTAWSCFLFLLFCLFGFSFFFIIFWNIEDTGFGECVMEKNSFPDYSMIPVSYLVN